MLKNDVRSGHNVNARSDHGCCVDQRADRRGAFHGVRQPDIQRKLGGLAAGSGEEQQSSYGEGAEHAPSFMGPMLLVNSGEQVAKIERAESLEQQKHAEHEAKVTDTVDDESFLAGIGSGFF